MGTEKCRLCCAPLALISLTCGKSRKKREYIRKLTEITTGIKFQKNDASKYICVFCICTMYNFHVFKVKSLQNEKLFKSCIQSQLKSTEKIKVDVPDLCDIELPSIDTLKTELFEWLKSKIDIQESVEVSVHDKIEKNEIDFDRLSTIGTQTNVPSVVMVDKSTQLEIHTYNVGCQYSVKTYDEKIQCSILPKTSNEEIQCSIIPVGYNKTTQTMDVTATITCELASPCNLNRNEAVDIDIQHSPIAVLQSQHDETEGKEGLATSNTCGNNEFCDLNSSKVVKISKNHESCNIFQENIPITSKSSHINKKDELSYVQKTYNAESVSEFSTKRDSNNKYKLDKRISVEKNITSKATKVNGSRFPNAQKTYNSTENITEFSSEKELPLELPHTSQIENSETSQPSAIENNQTLSTTGITTDDENSFTPLVDDCSSIKSECHSVDEHHCDKSKTKLDISIQSGGETPKAANLDSSFEIIKQKRKINTSDSEGTSSSTKRRRWNRTSNLKKPSNAEKRNLKAKKISVPLPIPCIKTELLENESMDPEHTETTLTSVDAQLEPKEFSTAELLCEIDSFLSPSTIEGETNSPLPSTPKSSSFSPKDPSPSFKYDTPRSSKLLMIQEKVEYVKICKLCDQTLYSKSERSKHMKSHMRCHLCKKVFKSVKKTKLHVDLECCKKTPKSVPVVCLDRMDFSGYNFSDFSGESRLSGTASPKNLSNSPLMK